MRLWVKITITIIILITLIFVYGRYINTTGFNAHPECVAVKVDSTYMLTTRGMSCPFIGMYTSIIGYKKIP